MQLLPVMFRDRWMRRSGLLAYAAALGWNLFIKSGLAVGWEWTSTGSPCLPNGHASKVQRQPGCQCLRWTPYGIPPSSVDRTL